MTTSRVLSLLRTRWTIGLLACLLQAACSAHTSSTPADWLSECVGRLQLSLPPDAEVAVTRKVRIESMLGMQPYRNEVDYSFPDGQAAGFTSLGYSGGDTLISEPASAQQLGDWLVAHRTVLLEKVRRQTQGRRAIDGTPFVATSVPLAGHSSSAYRLYGARYDVAVAVGDRLVHTAVTATAPDPESGRAYLEAFVSSMRPRQMFELPDRTGVCFPYVFIRDDDAHPRGVAVTFRLKSHPDVLIWLSDANGGRSVATENVGADTVTPKRDIQTFWSQRYQDREQYRLLSAQPLEMNSHEGLSSVVELTRKDGALDPGFFASVRGAGAADGDATDIQLFVIRDSRVAAQKGVQPMDKAEMLKLAREVAASIKRRSAH